MNTVTDTAWLCVLFCRGVHRVCPMRMQEPLLLGRFLGLFAWFLAVLASATPQSAQVRIYCGSLQFERAEWVTGVSLDLTTTIPELNRELVPNFGSGFYNYSSVLLLNNYDGINPSLIGALAVNLPPPVDANGNQYPDFFEAELGVGETHTTGSFVLPIGGGSVDATWSRLAGSPTGTCTLLFTFDLGQPPLSFTHQFTLIEYRGTLNYTSVSNTVSGSMWLTQTGYPSNALGGTLQFTKPPTNSYDGPTLNSGTWTNQFGQVVSYPALALSWSSNWPTNFSGLLEFTDGHPQTSAPDYRYWAISIDDSNDSDLDGFPDLADSSALVSPRAPCLGLFIATTNVNLTITGEVGRQHSIQHSQYLDPADWQTVQEVKLATDPEIFVLPMPSSTSGFWRVIAR